jgi:hypothetical protein
MAGWARMNRQRVGFYGSFHRMGRAIADDDIARPTHAAGRDPSDYRAVAPPVVANMSEFT